MKKLKFSAACLILSGSIICSSCIGSFGLWSSLKDWNNNIGNKFVNEIVFTNEDGYTITKKGEEDKPLTLIYDKEKNTWNASAEGQTFELITMNEDGTITFKQQDGTPVTVSPDLQGMISARQANSQSMFASR